MAMENATVYRGWARFKLFWALSRTPHGLLDMTTPAFAALAWLGTLPSLSVAVLGLATTFAGYTCVYALNDIVDYRNDQEKLDRGGLQDGEDYLDAVMVRHPMAQGFLTYREGVVWAAVWGTLALMGAYALNPVCALIFIAAAALETAYCQLWRITHLRTLVSGLVKSSGAVAAVFAVTPRPAPEFVFALLMMLFFWEIGGQNIPADWTDMEADRRMKARTIPVNFGVKRANQMILLFLALAVAATLWLFRLSPANFSTPYWIAAVLAGVYLLLVPALRLFKYRSRTDAVGLFNKASYYPAALMLLALVRAVC